MRSTTSYIALAVALVPAVVALPASLVARQTFQIPTCGVVRILRHRPATLLTTLLRMNALRGAFSMDVSHTIWDACAALSRARSHATFPSYSRASTANQANQRARKEPSFVSYNKHALWAEQITDSIFRVQGSLGDSL